MSASKAKPVAPLAYQRKEAAQALGVSDDFFDREIRDALGYVLVGSLRLWPVKELERWLSQNTTHVLDAAGRSGA